MTSDTRLLLLRHGTTDANVQGLFLGQTDAPLNDEGRQEAKALGEKLANTSLDLIVASDLVRASDTANAVLSAHQHPVELRIDPRLREVHLGDFEALPASQVHASHPQLVYDWTMKPNSVRMPGEHAETLGEVQTRAWDVVEALRAENKQRTIALVSHTFVILALICKALDIDLDRFHKMHLARASICTLEWRRYGPTLMCFNDVSHIGT